MRIGIVPPRRTVCIDREASVTYASRLMREQRVGELVVTEALQGKQIPAGIVSARDIVTRVVALDLDAAVVTVGDILWASSSRPVRAADSVPETVERLYASGGDALPVVDTNGNVSGILSLDDLLVALVSGRPLAGSRAR
jgi:CBS domain-containing protein